MNIAIIFAGGTGTRMHTKTMPKQFLELYGKPIIVHTIEHFEKHPAIDAIVVVCIRDWINYFNTLKDQYHLTKVKAVAPGGQTGQESIYNGLICAKEQLSENPESDIVLIHDGVRPIITSELIDDNIACVKKHGNSITAAKAVETVIKVNEKGELVDTIDRSLCKAAKAPQCFYLKDICEAHRWAAEHHQKDIIDSATLMSMYGAPLHTVECGTENIKITTAADFYIFRAIITAKENSQIWGI